MKKSKYQQYFHCFIVYILVPYAFWFSYQQNIVTILISAAFRGALPIRGRRLFQYGYPKVRRLLENCAYLTPGAYQRKFISYFYIDIHLVTLNRTETRSRSQFYKIPFQCGLFNISVESSNLEQKVPIPVFLLDLSLLKGTLMKI